MDDRSMRKPLRRSELAGCGAMGFLVAILLSPSIAVAEETASELFARGLADMLAGRYETGCPTIAESHRRYPQASKLFTLAECEAKQGRIATAVDHYGRYLEMLGELPAEKRAKQRTRQKIAEDQLAALTPHVPTLVLRLPSDAPPGTAVQRDGIDVPADALGVSVPVDPGEHLVTTQAPSGVVVEVRIVLARDEAKDELLEVRVPPSPERSADPSDAMARPAVPVAPPRPPAVPRSSNQRAVAFATGGLGIVGLGVGAVLGGLALNEKSTVDAECRSSGSISQTCTPDGKAAADRGQALATGSTVGFGAGLALLGGAAVLYLTDPSRKPGGSGSGTPHAGVVFTLEARYSAHDGAGFSARGAF